MARGCTAERRLAEPRAVLVPLDRWSEGVMVLLPRGAAAQGQHMTAARHESPDHAGVEPRRIELLGERTSVRRRGARHRAAATLFDRRSKRDEHRFSRAVFPEETRPRDGTPVRRQIRPAVAIEIGALLPMCASEERVAPLFVQLLREPEDRVGAGVARAIEQHLAFGLVARAPRDEIDDASDRRYAVERGRNTLDHFDLAEVHRRNLQEAERAGLTTIEWQTVRENLRVAPAKPLDADVRAAERRRCDLYAQAVGLVEQHRDIARRHHDLLLDFLRRHDLDAQRKIFHAATTPSRGDDHLFFVFRRLLQQVQVDEELVHVNELNFT